MSKGYWIFQSLPSFCPVYATMFAAYIALFYCQDYLSHLSLGVNKKPCAENVHTLIKLQLYFREVGIYCLTLSRLQIHTPNLCINGRKTKWFARAYLFRGNPWLAEVNTHTPAGLGNDFQNIVNIPGMSVQNLNPLSISIIQVGLIHRLYQKTTPFYVPILIFIYRLGRGYKYPLTPLFVEVGL